MFIQGLILTILAVLAGLVAFLIGFIGWVILKLMKEELNLKITTDPNSKNK